MKAAKHAPSTGGSTLFNIQNGQNLPSLSKDESNIDLFANHGIVCSPLLDGSITKNSSLKKVMKEPPEISCASMQGESIP